MGDVPAQHRTLARRLHAKAALLLRQRRYLGVVQRPRRRGGRRRQLRLPQGRGFASQLRARLLRRHGREQGRGGGRRLVLRLARGEDDRLRDGDSLPKHGGQRPPRQVLPVRVARRPGVLDARPDGRASLRAAADGLPVRGRRVRPHPGRLERAGRRRGLLRDSRAGIPLERRAARVPHRRPGYGQVLRHVHGISRTRRARGGGARSLRSGAYRLGGGAHRVGAGA